MKRAVAYLRKSKVTSDRHISWEVQERAIRDTAARHGDTDLTILSDWSRSGRGQFTHRRPEYLKLKQMVAGGEVATIYAYSLSRLTRSISEYADLAQACTEQGVTIRLVNGGDQDYSSADGRFRVGILALLAQMEAEIASERAVDNVKYRRERGDYLGVAPYGSMVKDGKLVANPDEDVDAVIDAYQRSGSFMGAAKLLTKEGVKPRNGGYWQDQTVARIIRRDGRLHLPKTEQGVKAKADHLLYRLLRCGNCDTILTPTKKHGGKNTVYFCSLARRDPSHPRPYGVAESRLIEWVKAEANRLRPPKHVQLAESNRQDRDALLDKREQLGWALVNGVLTDREAVQREQAAIDAALEAMDVQEEVVDLGPIDWTKEPSILNGLLRAMWNHVELNEQMKPVVASWKTPEWRSNRP